MALNLYVAMWPHNHSKFISILSFHVKIVHSAWCDKLTSGRAHTVFGLALTLTLNHEKISVKPARDTENGMPRSVDVTTKNTSEIDVSIGTNVRKIKIVVSWENVLIMVVPPCQRNNVTVNLAFMDQGVTENRHLSRQILIFPCTRQKNWRPALSCTTEFWTNRRSWKLHWWQIVHRG